VGDEINLDVPSGTITMKILELKWAPPQYDRILLEKVKVDYEIVPHDPDHPNLIVTGGLRDYKEPLQVFFQGSEVHVSVQNPYAYTYIVEYWEDDLLDKKNRLVIDEGDEWITEETFEAKTTSESEFDLILEDLPIGLYRVRIEGTNYWSNNFYVIFDVENSVHDENIENIIENYLTKSYTAAWGADFIFYNYRKKCLVEVSTSHYDEKLLLTMASISGKGKDDRPFTEDTAISKFARNVRIFMAFTSVDKKKPPKDIIEYIEIIKSGKDSVGDCDGYSTFLVALARSSGIPARLISGFGDINWFSFDWKHAWTEVYNHGNWQVWDCHSSEKPDNPYASYKEYIEKAGVGQVYDVFDERDVNRCPDYGPCDNSLNRITGVIRCPADLHAYDSQGRHVGVNAQGDIDLGIPDAYYSGPDSEPESIVIFDQNEDITFKIEALDTGEFDFTLIQNSDAKTTNVTYLDVPITKTTEATVEVSQANPTYTMEIDKYGDGTTLETKKPDSIETDAGQDKYSIQLHTGWNLISIPLIPDDTDVLDIMNTVDGNWNSIWSYEAGNWKRYDLTGPNFLNDLTTIEPEKGYWIDMKSEDTLYVSGSEPTVKSISLSAGWNLVGYNSLSSMSTTEAMNSVDGNWNSVWSYENGNWKRYDLTGPDFLNDLTTMESGKGYWIDMKSSDTWSLGA
jgi:hypothetical protein